MTVGFVMGGPGCGKSATCELIRDGFGFVIIASGTMLRNEVASGSAAGGNYTRFECSFGPLVLSVVFCSLVLSVVF